AYTCHPTIKFTGEWSKTSLNFLDVKLSVCDTEMYSKPTDCNTLLLSSSYHTPHIISAIPKSQYLRARRIASTNNILCPSDVTLKKERKLLWGPPKRGIYACLNCVCCSSIIKVETICHATKGNTIHFRDYTTFDTKNVIYMLKCPCGLAYVGQISRAVKERIKEHKGNIRNFTKGTQSDTLVSKHFTSCGHHQIQLKWLVLEHVKVPKRGGNIQKRQLQREEICIKKTTE
ncbi:hypothetical protein XELAEV_18023121mg, partial [Xenopus laevis]